MLPYRYKHGVTYPWDLQTDDSFMTAHVVRGSDNNSVNEYPDTLKRWDNTFCVLLVYTVQQVQTTGAMSLFVVPGQITPVIRLK